MQTPRNLTPTPLLQRLRVCVGTGCHAADVVVVDDRHGLIIRPTTARPKGTLCLLIAQDLLPAFGTEHPLSYRVQMPREKVGVVAMGRNDMAGLRQPEQPPLAISLRFRATISAAERPPGPTGSLTDSLIGPGGAVAEAAGGLPARRPRTARPAARRRRADRRLRRRDRRRRRHPRPLRRARPRRAAARPRRDRLRPRARRRDDPALRLHQQRPIAFPKDGCDFPFIHALIVASDTPRSCAVKCWLSR